MLETRPKPAAVRHERYAKRLKAAASAARACPFIPYAPSLKQLEALAAPEREMLYGGEVGGGKSDFILMDAAICAYYSGDYDGLILRKTLPDLARANALIPRSHEWFGGGEDRWGKGKAPTWSEQRKTWTFPNGATLAFGYLDGPRDHERYQGPSYTRIYIDESTQIREKQIRYMSSRLRRIIGTPIPVALRLCSNPGGESHSYHYENFVAPRVVMPNRRFISAGLEDNPGYDTEEYLATMQVLDDVTYRQLAYGEWISGGEDKPFKYEYWANQNRFSMRDSRTRNRAIGRWSVWDTANVDKDTAAYTAGVTFEVLDDYRVLAYPSFHDRVEFDALPDEVKTVAGSLNFDGRLKGLVVEDAASGVQLIQWLRKDPDAEWFDDRLYASKPPKGGKMAAWTAAAIWCRRNVVELPWPDGAVPLLWDFEREVFNVPNTEHYDFADAFALGINFLERHYRVLSTRWALMMEEAEEAERERRARAEAIGAGA